jgi:hypothetical protein
MPIAFTRFFHFGGPTDSEPHMTQILQPWRSRCFFGPRWFAEVFESNARELQILAGNLQPDPL